MREITTDKPYSFCVIDKIGGHNNIFSANKVTEYASWLNILTHIPDENIKNMDNKTSESNNNQKDLMKEKIQVAKKYFEKRRISNV